MPVAGARPDELRRLAHVLGGAADEVARLRRRIAAAQERSRVGRFDPRSLMRLEAWLDDSAADVRRRAARLDEEGRWRSPGDLRPPRVSGGACGAVLVPVGERLFAASPLRCPPAVGARHERTFATLVPPTGLVVYSGRRAGGTGGMGGGRRRLTKEEVLARKRLPHGEGVPFGFEPDPRWRPGQPLTWDPEQRGYVDAKGDVWRRGPSRTPGDPFEWDVQLRKDSPWKKDSKDGKHLNVDLKGRISH